MKFRARVIGARLQHFARGLAPSFGVLEGVHAGALVVGLGFLTACGAEKASSDNAVATTTGPAAATTPTPPATQTTGADPSSGSTNETTATSPSPTATPTTSVTSDPTSVAPVTTSTNTGSTTPTADSEPAVDTTDVSPPGGTSSAEVPTDDASSEGAPDTAGPASPGTSAGCGKTPTLKSGTATIDVDGTAREYILQLPSDYDSSKPYKLIFGLHWRGGQASDVANGGTVGLGNYYGLEALADGSAIFVAPNGIDNGWANTGGRDINFLKAILAAFQDDLCIDLERIFSVGFSYGGMMSFAIACEMGDVFRAIAPLSGALYSGCGNGTDPIAMWGAHGTSDDVVPIADGRAGLQEVLDRNHCGTETTPTSTDTCVSYNGCDEGYPVTWCEFDGGHGPQRWQVQPIWEFFSQF